MPIRPRPSCRRACWRPSTAPTSFRSGTSRTANTRRSARSRIACALAADAAVRELGWKKPYHVDADHIRLETVDGFIASSDFYTLDVADAIGKPADAAAVKAFVDRHPELVGRLEIPGIDEPFEIKRADVERIAGKYLLAVQEAGRIYRRIVQLKGEEKFITEVSMDETDSPQTPPELLVILAAIADEKIPMQTIAPKFTGRFNKGVDYVGDLAQFEKEFNADLAVIAFAVRKYGLPASLKLSVHSGSDKFSIYAPIRRAIARFDAGLHIKTAGTNWLEEVIGLAESGGAGLELAKEIYVNALHKIDALCAPYASVIDIDPQQTTFRGRGARLVERAIRGGSAARPAQSSFQSASAAIDSCGLQSRGAAGRPLFEDAQDVRSHDRQERDGEPLPAAFEAAVC